MDYIPTTVGTLDKTPINFPGYSFFTKKKTRISNYVLVKVLPFLFLKLIVLVPIINSHKQIPISPMEAGIPTIVENIVLWKSEYRNPPKNVIK